MQVARLLIVFVFILYAGNSFAQQDVGQQFEGFNLEGYTDTGDKSWDVNGSTADLEGTKINLRDVNANSYGDGTVNLKADKGMVDQASGKMELHDDVIITTEDGQQLMTNSLYWDREGDVVTSEDDVLITDQGLTVSGVGLEARPGLKRSQVNKQVRALVDIDKVGKDSADEYEGAGTSRSPLTITSDGPMVIDQASKMATFQDNVVAVQEGYVLTADRMEVYMNSKMNDINEIVCIGNVQIEQGENKTYAERAVFNRKTERLTLSGRPKLILLTEGDGGLTSFRN